MAEKKVDIGGEDTSVINKPEHQKMFESRLALGRPLGWGHLRSGHCQQKKGNPVPSAPPCDQRVGGRVQACAAGVSMRRQRVRRQRWDPEVRPEPGASSNQTAQATTAGAGARRSPPSTRRPWRPGRGTGGSTRPRSAWGWPWAARSTARRTPRTAGVWGRGPATVCSGWRAGWTQKEKAWSSESHGLLLEKKRSDLGSSERTPLREIVCKRSRTDNLKKKIRCCSILRIMDAKHVV